MFAVRPCVPEHGRALKPYNRPHPCRDSAEFSRCLHRALVEEPKPLSPNELHALTWEAATDRFLDVADMGPGHWVQPLETAVDKFLHSVYNGLTGMEFLRVACGAGTRTRDMPARITDYVPCEDDVGGFFDNSARVKRSWEGKMAALEAARKKAAEAAAAAEREAAAAAATATAKSR